MKNCNYFKGVSKNDLFFGKNGSNMIIYFTKSTIIDKIYNCSWPYKNLNIGRIPSFPYVRHALLQRLYEIFRNRVIIVTAYKIN